MEGPSIVIATEEFAPYFGKPLKKVSGTATIPMAQIKKRRLTEARSWGKHLILIFGDLKLRIHFLMFGSYRINDPRENRIPKLEIQIGADTLYFYSCAIKVLEGELDDLYDWSIDVMSPEWDPKQAITALKAKPKSMICDVLMDQTIFSGIGNIMKNETQFNLKLQPETRIEALSPAQLRSLVKEARAYAFQFLEWKKAGVLKRNWKIFRKKKCAICERAVKKRPTGKLKRISHYCTHCQKLQEI